jgi:ankyrin repeat protein
MVTLFAMDPKFLESRTTLGLTAVMAASLLGEVSSIQWLLQVGADVTMRDYHGRTALHMACSRCSPDHEAICELLLEALFEGPSNGKEEAAIETLILADKYGKTPLLEAVKFMYGNAKPILLLLSTRVYFPPCPTHDEVILCEDEEAFIIEFTLKDWKRGAGRAERLRFGEAVSYWAMLNGRSDLLEINSDIAFNRGGAS